jgi:predicted transposase YbfD/YdcC
MAGRPAATPGPGPPTPRRPRRAVAVDGKTLRGSGHHHAAPVHLLAAMDHTTGAVLAQTEVDHATNEITRFRPLLERLDLSDTVVTADAMHTQREHAEWLVTHKHAAWLLVVKANQPALRQQLERLPWRQVPIADTTRDRGHGRVEARQLQVTTVAGLGFPTPPRRSASLAASGRCAAAARAPSWCTRSPASPPPRQAPPAWPTGCAATGASRRCITSAMSPSVRTPPRSAAVPPPGAMASLRNLAIGILGAHGDRNIAAALRYYARDATRLLPLLGLTGP